MKPKVKKICLIKDGFDDHYFSTLIIWTVCLDDSIWFLLEAGGKCMGTDPKKEEKGETGKDFDKWLD